MLQRDSIPKGFGLEDSSAFAGDEPSVATRKAS